MKRAGGRRLPASLKVRGALVAGVALALLVGSYAAMAYERTPGSGSGNATIGQFANALDHFEVTPATGAQTSGVAFSLTVKAEDSGNHVLTGYTGTIAFSSNDPQAAFAGTGTYTFVAGDSGVHTFTSAVTLATAGSGKTVTVTGGGKTGQASFTVNPGTATKLLFTTQPAGAIGGAAFTTQPVVTAQDAAGNTATSYAGTVALSITSGTGTAGAALSGCTGVLAAGVTTFSGCQIDLAGTGYTIRAGDGTLTKNSNAFAVTISGVSQLVVTTTPAGAKGGAVFTTQPVVTAEDAGGNPVTSYSGTVTLSITSGTGTATAALNGCSGALASGVVTFSGCKIDKSGTAYTLHATDGTLSADSGAFDVAVGPAAQLLFTTQPSGATSGAALATQPAVTAEDAGGNIVTTYAGTLALGITTGTGSAGAALTGCSGVLAAGVTTFSACEIDMSGAGYELNAADGTLSVDSAAFDVAPGALSQLVFTTAPSGATGGTAFTTQPVVTAEDAAGNTVTSYAGTLTLSIKGNTGDPTAKLTGCSGASSLGVTTFSGCTLDKAATGYQLHATDGTLSKNSTAFDVLVGPASQLVFTTQPTGATGGTAFTTQPVITAEDAGNNTVTTYAGTVALTIQNGTGTSGAALSGCAGVPAAGVIAFSGCAIDLSGTGYKLHAADGTLTKNSAAVDVAVGPLAQIGFTTKPSGATGGTAFTTQPVVSGEDAGGNVVATYAGTVVLSITSGTGATGAVLSGCTAPAPVAGVTTFSGCTIDKNKDGYQIHATDGTLSADSNAFRVSVGPLAQLAFTKVPAGTTGGVVFAPKPVVSAEDAGGNTIGSYAGTVTISLTTGTGAAGATLSGCTGALSSGDTTFSACQLDKAGTGYELHATDGTLSTDSIPFDVAVGPVTQLAFTAQPSGATGGTAFTTQPVVAGEDAGGNVATSYTGVVTLTIKNNTGDPTAKLTQCAGVLASGVTTFTGCQIDKAFAAYQVHASDGTLIKNSLPFDVTVGPVSALVFSTQPTGSTGGIALGTQPVITAQDAGGNTVTAYAGTVALSIANNTGTTGAALTGCAGVPAAGVITFSGCAIDKAGTAYKLKASDGTLTKTSAAFDITVGPLAKIGFTAKPAGATGGLPFTTQPVVAGQDAGGNTVTSYTGTVVLSIGAGSPAGVLSGCTAPAPVAGVTTFSGCAIDKSSSNTYTLHATDGTLQTDSGTFKVNVGPLAQLVWTKSPANGTHGAALVPQPKLTGADAGGNAVQSYAGTITLTIKSGTGAAGAVLSACAAGAPNNGVITFSGCTIDLVGTGYQLHASDGTLASDSATFNLT